LEAWRTEANTGAAAGERPSPAAALEAAFTRIHDRQMRGLPMLNPALGVEAVGFRPWQEHWLGVLVTPWFMNLMLLPRRADQWQPLALRDKRRWRFPAGEFEFIGGRDAGVGDYQACSLFSPMLDFATHEGAQATALAVLHGLFEPGAPAPAPVTAAAPAAMLSKREWLFGRSRGPGHGA
jgi:[NiFe] hydrogenase assembly HybE family chaperone